MARGEILFRQWELIKVLQAHRFGVSTDELCTRLECNRRTVQRDLAVLQDIFPITHEQRDRGKRFWKLAHGVVESEQLQLTMTEMLSLFLSQQLLIPLSGTQFGDGLQTALQKIRALLPAQALAYFESLDGSFLIRNVGGDDHSVKDKEIRILNEAILSGHKVRLVYESVKSGRRIDSEFHPYGMVLLYASLYCVGYFACFEEIRTIKVTRIRDVMRLEEIFQRPEGFSLAAHFQSAFGVFQSDQVRTFEVRFRDWAATNVREIRWHPSQKIIRQSKNTLVARFSLSSEVEFKRWILGFGRFATVLSPKTFAREVRDEHLAAADRQRM
ncbi:MAG: transcriptional regulator [Phycisphaeraceae bacterium]|nr:transcriptional regulator [Phycisphaeraceae bacterium]